MTCPCQHCVACPCDASRKGGLCILCRGPQRCFDQGHQALVARMLRLGRSDREISRMLSHVARGISEGLAVVTGG